jgi:quercetin dioxygenase-like cupin family protein
VVKAEEDSVHGLHGSRGLGGVDMDAIVLNQEELPRFGNTYEFEGAQHHTGVSFIWVDMPPGDRIRLHDHPYQEIFIIQEGIATFTVGGATLEAPAGRVVIVPAGVPHAFVNAGDRQLRQVDIHVSPQIITRWLEDDSLS